MTEELEDSKKKKPGLSDGSVVALIGVIFVAVVLVASTIVWNIVDRARPTGTPADMGEVTAVGPLKIQLPKDWKVSIIDNVTYAAPASTDCKPEEATCKTIAVHDTRTFRPGNWQAKTGIYNCPTNKQEGPAAPVERPTIQIGKDKRGAFHRTLELCGLSRGHTLTVYEVQDPPALIIVKTSGNPKQILPGVEQLLKSDAARIG